MLKRLSSGEMLSGECLLKQHVFCPDIQAGCQCACNHQGKYAPVNTNADTITGVHKLSRNISVAETFTTKKIESINSLLKTSYDEIKREVFFDIPNFTFVGSTVRDAIYGSGPDIYEVKIQDTGLEVPSMYKKLLTKYFEGFNNYSLSDDGITSFTIDTVFGPKEVRIIPNDYQYHWSCDRSYFDTLGIGSWSRISASPISLHNKPQITDPKAVLQQGVDIASKYGWSIELESINWLADAIKYSEPPEKVNETLIGFRAYKITNGYLYGQHNVAWRSETLTVDCPDFVRHIKETDADWRMAGLGGGKSVDECGIYIHKDPATCLYEVSNIQAMAMVYAYGVVGDFEKGYRAQHCKIVKLWVFENTASGKAFTPQLAPVYNVENGIIVGAKYADFLYDKEVIQWAGR